MSTNRYITRHEHGADWAIVDTRDGNVVATGLSDEEAEDAAKARNNESENNFKK
jgi:hypothetical protein